MENSEIKHIQKKVMLSRRKAVQGLFWIMAGVSISCSPVKLVLDIKRETIFGDPSDEDKTLRSFISTIVPGADTMHSHSTDVFSDEFYKFKKCKSAFVNDLNERSVGLFNQEFAMLSQEDRTKVVAHGLQSNRIISTLYSGAIFIVQITVYCGITNEQAGCALIDFEGSYNFESTSYTGNDDFFGNASCRYGNPE